MMEMIEMIITANEHVWYILECKIIFSFAKCGENEGSLNYQSP